MKNNSFSSKTKIIALILAILIALSLMAPLIFRSFAENLTTSTSTASSINSSGRVIVNYYSGVPDDLTKDSPDFDLTVGLLDPNVQAVEGFDEGTGYAVLESESFYGQTTNTGTLRQSGNTNSDGPMKMTATFRGVKYNGKSNVLTLRVGYAINGVVKSEQVQFLVSQISIEEDEDKKKDPPPPPSPKVVINECTYGDKTINTEESFTLNFSYFNSSSAVKMENLKIEVSGGENFVIKNNSNTFYVEELGPKGIKSQSVDFTALKSIKESSSYPIDLRFSYEYVINKERKAGEDKTQIFIPVHKLVPPPRLTIGEIVCSPDSIEPEEESTVTIKLANKGESMVKNVSIAINGNFKSSSGYSQEIGGIDANKTASKTFTITTLPAPKTNKSSQNAVEGTESQPVEQTTQNVENKLSGIAVITFEDDDGNQHTIDRTFGINVNIEEEDDDMMGGEAMPADEAQQEQVPAKTAKKLSTPWLIGIISGGVVVLGGASYFVIKRIKAKRSELLDEDI